LLARQLYALAALGRHATAAQTLLERIAGGDDGFTLEDRHIELIGYVAAASPSPERLGRAMESRLRELITQLPAEEREARASRLALARAAALPDEEAMRVLRERIAEAPGDSGAISALLRRAASGEDAAPELARQVTALIAQSPLDERAYTGAAIRLADDAGSLLDAMPDSGAVPPAGPEDRARMLLRARLLTTLGRDEEAETILRALVRSDDAFAPAVSALAELLIDQRRLDEASIVIDQLDPAAGEPALLAKAGGLASVGREDEARELLEAAADRPDASAALVFRLGALLERSGDAEGAAERYAQAVDLNPRLEEAHAALIRLYNRTGPLADRERLFAAVRKLREQIPSARTLRWLRAQELASTGQYGAAERALRDLAEERDDPLVTRALVSVWLATGSADEAETYLRERLDRTPAESELIVQLARTLSAQSRHEEAADLLRQQLERRPGDAAVSLRLETILRDELDRPEEADELALRRLETGPITVGGALQQAAVMLRQERFSLAAQQLRRALQVARERGVPLDLAQIRGSLGVVQRVGAAAQQDGSLRADAIELMETIASLDVQLPEQAHRLRTLLLIAADSRLDRVERAVTRAYEDVGSQADAVATAAAQALFPTDPLAALRLVETAARATSRPSTRIATLWLGLLAQIPDPGSAANLLELLVSTDLAAATARETLSNPENLAGATQGEAAATIAFALASAASGRDQQAESLDLYRLTLDYDPDHAMAGNNLGYQLLVDGDLDEAEPLIERAYANNNESPAIIDSLGWLRYKQGRFADELDPAGEVVSEGAVSILARAVEIALKQNDAGLFELHSHYGDALWRVGRTEEAIEQWRAARDAALALRRRLGDNAPSIVDESLDASQARLDAAAAGEAPPIAPTHAERTAPQDGDGVVPEPAGL
jgi:tetratricopeptide (TPR) repeat protein